MPHFRCLFGPPFSSFHLDFFFFLLFIYFHFGDIDRKQFGILRTNYFCGMWFLQVSGGLLQESVTGGSSGIGSYLGWAMAAIYMGGRLPQICLNVRFTFLILLLIYDLLASFYYSSDRTKLFLQFSPSWWLHSSSVHKCFWLCSSRNFKTLETYMGELYVPCLC